MNRERDIFRERRHFDGEHAFGDHVSSTNAGNADAKHALGLRIDEKFGEALGTIERSRTARRCPGKFRDFDFNIFFLRLRFGQPCPCNFRIGEDDGRNSSRLECNFVSGDGFNGRAPFVHGLMRQHGLANHVADRVDCGIRSLQLLVHFDETFGANFGLRLI